MTESYSQLRKNVENILNEYYPEKVICQVPEFLSSFQLNQQLLPTSIMFVLNFNSQSYEFVSENISQLFSVAPEILVKGGINEGLKLFTESSRKVFANRLLPEMFFQFRKAVDEGYNVLNFRVHYNINMESPLKGAVNTMHVIKPVVLDSKGMPLLALKYIFDISDYSNETEIGLTFEYIENNKTSVFFNNSYHSDLQDISKREAEIIQHIGLGLSSKEIADRLSISIHTVNTHRKNIMRKYNIHNFQQSFYKRK